MNSPTHRRVAIRFVFHVCLAAALFSLTGCGEKPSSEDVKVPYKVTVTIGMVADVIREVGGERVDVHTIIGEGVDPHLYKPTTTDIKALQAANVIFYNGLLLEGKMGDVLVKVARTGKPVYAVTEEILEQEADSLIIDESEHYDPHVWMDVQAWMKATEVITKALTEYDAAGAETYTANSKKYLQRLEELDRYARESIASIPSDQRVLVTAHDAFGYLGRAYGLEVRGIQGLSTESEAGLRDIEDLVRFLVAQKIPAVFVESTISDKNIRALVEGTQEQGHTVSIGGELFSDAMGVAGSYEGTYLGMIDHNVTTLTRALGGQAPEKGLHGKLSAH